MSTSRSIAIAVFDLDGTITRRDTYLQYLVRFLLRHPLRVFRCWRLPWFVLAFKMHLIKNTTLKITFLDAILAGERRDDVQRWSEEFVEWLLRTQVRRAAYARIRHHAEMGHRLVLVSASFDFYVESMAQSLGFHEVICTRSSWDDGGRLLGKIDGENCYGENKIAALRTALGDAWPNRVTAAYSDHHSDLPLLEAADQPIAVNPTSKLGEIAERRGIAVEDWND